MFDIFNKYIQQLNIKIESHHQDILFLYWQFLLNKNNYINLISRHGSLECRIVNHLVDSICPLMIDWPENINVMDFGSGAGLPGIPLKICRENWNMTLVESKTKKANFLSEVCNYLNIKNYTIINNFIDNKFDFNNQKFDLITVRAVGTIKNIINNIYPFLNHNGFIVFYKGPNYQKELNNIDLISNIYRLSLFKIYNFTLPLINSERNLLLFKKI
jgi:16S rRNA (guanine527-N7)-methyltransferase